MRIRWASGNVRYPRVTAAEVVLPRPNAFSFPMSLTPSRRRTRRSFVRRPRRRQSGGPSYARAERTYAGMAHGASRGFRGRVRLFKRYRLTS